jgi:DNA-directed RNA polymerase specialized sigma24 family protein
VPPEPPDRPDDQFRALYEAELAYVMRSLRRLGVPERELQDLAHDVFVVVYRRWAEFDRSRAARPWLFGIALRTASRALERRWRQAEVPVGAETMGGLGRGRPRHLRRVQRVEGTRRGDHLRRLFRR